ncbi:hypothetical protein GCM10023317_33500 [Actinopolymorpha pittospori]
MNGMDYDVIICGGGPVGLMLACELRLRGVAVAVLERLAEPDLTIKAGSINLPTLEALYRRGLLSKVNQAQQEMLKAFGGSLPEGPKPVGHFAGIFMWSDKLDETVFAIEGPAAGLGIVSQQQVEAILAERAGELGVHLRRGVEVTGFETDDDSITVHAGDLRLRAGWLVGCDGGRSLVRKLAGFAFPGTDPEITGHQAVVDMEGSDQLGRGWNTTPTGTYAHGPGPAASSPWSSTALRSTVTHPSRARSWRRACATSPAPTCGSRRSGPPRASPTTPARPPPTVWAAYFLPVTRHTCTPRSVARDSTSASVTP